MLPDYEDSPAAGLDLDGRFYSITAYCVTLEKDSPVTLPILTCLLNSDLLFWVLGKTGTSVAAGICPFHPQYLDRLPIAIPDKEAKVRLQKSRNRNEDRLRGCKAQSEYHCLPPLQC